MKKLFLILLPLLFIGCSRTEDIVDQGSLDEIKTFVDTETISFYSKSSGSANQIIYVSKDNNTGVLYYTSLITITSFTRTVSYGFATPIMKADGTCLTYDEWKLNNE